MAKAKEEQPELTARQLEFLNTYRQLERELGRGPSHQELFDSMRGRYSVKAGVQQMVDKLHDMGLLVKPHWSEGCTTKTGRHALVRARRRKLI